MKYRTIVADPPWPYRDANSSHSALQKDPRTRKVNDWAYEPLSLEQICRLPIRKVAEEAAHLYLWTTNAFMVEAHDVARAWGFRPKTILTWGKVCHADRTRASLKTGWYFRGATEHVIFAVRGVLRIKGTWPTLYLWPRIGQHSVKPEAFYDVVEQASPGPYLELFARRHRLGWDVWGDESANTAELPA